MGGEIFQSAANSDSSFTRGEGSGYRDGIYYSKRPPVLIPSDPFLDFTTYTLGSDRYSDRVALVDGPTGESLTYQELRNRVRCVASGLASVVGVNQGDTVMILSPNSIDFPVLSFAITALGAVVTTVNPLNTVQEILKQMTSSKTTHVAAVPELTEAATLLNIPLILIDTGREAIIYTAHEGNDRIHGVRPAAYFSKLLKADPEKVPKVLIRQTDTALLLYSSGTTGNSKGVIISHGNVIAASCQSHDVSFNEAVQRTYIVSIPMFHLYGMVLVLFAQLKRGSKLVTSPKFEFPKFLEAIQKYKVTHAQVVPPILNAMTKSPLVEKYDLSSLKLIGVGAAPTANAVLIACAKRFKGVFIREGYGLTESGGMGSSTPTDSVRRCYGSVGILAPNMEAKIVDLESGKPMSPNHSGEIWLRGPANMQGYLNREKETAETLDKENWLHTGDVGYFADDGYLFIVDRIKELIKYNGYQVTPVEIEAVLITHHEIVDTVVAGFPDESSGQIPVAFVVRKMGSSLSEEDVKNFVAKQVAPHKKVRKVVFINAVPRSAAGKVLRRQLKLPAISKL